MGGEHNDDEPSPTPPPSGALGAPGQHQPQSRTQTPTQAQSLSPTPFVFQAQQGQQQPPPQHQHEQSQSQSHPLLIQQHEQPQARPKTGAPRVKPDPDQRSAQPETLPENIDDLTPEEASRIIHSHRKVRYGTACWPCRQRKVRCDNQMPCENCVKRDHPKLCSYKPKHPGSSSVASVTASISTTSTGSRKRALSPSGADREPGRADRKNSWPRPSHNVDDLHHLEVTRYMGQNSMPALLREQSQVSPDQKDSDGQDVLRQGMQSIFGLNTSAPFPLMSSRHLETLTQDMTSELPSDREVMRLFNIYKETPQTFWGFVVDIQDLESRLVTYLTERSDKAQDERGSIRSPKPVSASWLAILFGVLAVGSQFSDAPYSVRTRDAQRYMQIAFHFLRTSNFLLRPTFETIQAMILTGFVLINDMKAEASWAMLGLCCRLAISLGLHRPYKEDGRESGPPDDKSNEMVRRKIWWTCQWHDILVSLSFDRNPMTNIPCCPIPMRVESHTNGYTYLETMYHLVDIIGTRLTPGSSTSFEYILDTCDRIESLRQRCAPHLRDEPQNPTEYRNANDSLQRYGIRLHTHFIISVACRPALRRDCPYNAEQKRILAERCRASHIETVRMFLKMHQLSVVPTRSWAYTYHGLSSALLLAILPETRANPEVRQLQGDLIAALSATQAKESGIPGTSPEDKDIELAGPLWRALAALKNIYDHGSIAGSTARGSCVASSSSGSGSRSPLPPGFPIPGQQLCAAVSHIQALEQHQQQQQQPQRQQPTGMNAHQDAAIAMAAMQNGGQMSDMPSNLPYPPSSGEPAPLNLQNLSSLDPTTYMSPMEVYDHIFWPTSADPLNTGIDTMTMDFLQPPPGSFFYR